MFFFFAPLKYPTIQIVPISELLQYPNSSKIRIVKYLNSLNIRIVRIYKQFGQSNSSDIRIIQIYEYFEYLNSLD